jgi:hypothetical protein
MNDQFIAVIDAQKILAFEDGAISDWIDGEELRDRTVEGS